MTNYYLVDSGYTGPVPSGFVAVSDGTLWLRNGDQVVISTDRSSDVTLRPESGFSQSQTAPTITLEDGVHNSFGVYTNTAAFRQDLIVEVQTGTGTVAPNVNLFLDRTDGATVDIAAGSRIGQIKTGNDDSDHDRITIGDGAQTGAIDTGAGHDVVIIGENVVINGDITTGPWSSSFNNDVLDIGAGTRIIGRINTGSGNDTVVLGNNVSVEGGSGMDWSIQTDHGDDILHIGDGVSIAGSVETWSGEDTVIVGGSYTVGGTVYMNTFDDVLTFQRTPEINGRALYQDLMAQGWVRGDGYREYVFPEYKWLDEFSFDGVNYHNMEKIIGPICFGAGAMITTATGPVPVETLVPGVLVQTRDSGLRPIRWIGRRHVSRAELNAAPDLGPIRMRRGALGRDLPARDLLVSPQHRILVRSAIALRMFGTDEVLVAAKHLLAIDGVDPAPCPAGVDYYHLLFDDHQVIFSNGAATESLYTGPQALQSVGAAARAEIFALFPALRDRARSHATPGARLLVSGRQARQLARRHIRNQRALAG